MKNRDKLKTIRSLKEFEEKARLRSKEYEALKYSFFMAGENEEGNRNEEAFRRYYIRPRMLRDVSSINTSVSLLGNTFPFPIGLSPTGYHHIADPDGELATARAASKEQCLMIMSCVSSRSPQEVAECANNNSRWLQIYILKDRSATLRLVELAEKFGFSALVVTVDSPVGGLWVKKMSPEFREKHILPHTGELKVVRDLLDPSLVFEDLLWLKARTKLPIIAKGILSGKDAELAVRHGVSAIIVSNHGGRQIGGVVPTIEVLEEVVDAVKLIDPRVEVYLDGGVRTGSDVFRACALGARAVFIGKPIIWGLSFAGEDGVRKVLQILKEEFYLTMQLAGMKHLDEITKDMIVKDINFSKL